MQLRRTLAPGADGLSESVGLLAMRLAGGALMAILHGWGKYSAYAERAAKFPDPLGVSPEISMGLTVFAELFCAGLLVIGLATRWAAVFGAITMFVAAFVIHGDDPLRKQELALMYLSIYTALICLGPGRFSLDRVIYGRSG